MSITSKQEHFYVLNISAIHHYDSFERLLSIKVYGKDFNLKSLLLLRLGYKGIQTCGQ